MRRTTLKILCLFTFTALAVGAASASPASAATGTFLVSNSPVVYTATQSSPVHTITLPKNRTLSCSTALFAGTITNGAKEMKAKPTYHSCSTKSGETVLPAIVSPAGCSFRFYDLTSPMFSIYNVITDVVCGFGESIRITVKNSAGTETLCEYAIESKTLLSNAMIFDALNNTLEIAIVKMLVPAKKLIGTVGNCGETSTELIYNGNSLVSPWTGTLGIDE